MPTQFIFKLSEKFPFGALALGTFYTETEFLSDLVQILNRAASIGVLLASHPQIANISFTDSVGGGKAVQNLATKNNLKKITLELSKKNPTIIFDNIELEKALKGYIYLFLLLRISKRDTEIYIGYAGSCSTLARSVLVSPFLTKAYIF